MTPLRQRHLEDLQLRNYSPQTQQLYVEGISLYARHFKQSPEQLSGERLDLCPVCQKGRMVRLEILTQDFLPPNRSPPSGAAAPHLN